MTLLLTTRHAADGTLDTVGSLNHPDLTFKLEHRFIPELLPIETTEQPMLPIDNYAITREVSRVFLDMYGPWDSDMSEILARNFIPESLNGDNMFLCPDNIYRPAKATKRFSELPTMMAIELPRVYHNFETDKREVDCSSIGVPAILDMTNDYYDHMFTSDCERKKYAIMGMIVGKYNPNTDYTTWHIRVRIPGTDYWKQCNHTRDLMCFSDPNCQSERLMHQEHALDMSGGMMELGLIYMDVSTIWIEPRAYAFAVNKNKPAWLKHWHQAYARVCAENRAESSA